MNWKAISFDWNQVRAFLATAEEGSFSGGARVLGLTQPTLGRQVAALEQDLGVLLFERFGRSLELTPSGLELLEHVRVMGDAAHRVSLAASGQSQTIEGVVRVTATNVFAVYLLPPVIEHLHEIAPKLEIDIVASNELRDRRREADIAIRHVRPVEPDLVARLVNESDGSLYASQRYLKRYGRPRSPADLTGHYFVGSSNQQEMVNYLTRLGISPARENFRFGTDCALVMWEMARQGLGMCLMATTVAARTPGMEPVFPDLAPMTFPTWLVAHRELYTSRRIRLVYDVLAEFLSNGGDAPA
ncbi:LysR family transcriptional regulator [Methyloceanibacter methanicus]|uniref:LysR family transcriptional regulator n=1 Tax=Methyloceanibacter methanicus TaxID=1774968 RepID=A0A1E3W386_9HYPH|nr:LysR family transcriptional regulator [Methyloceanibacter methanicus]ODS00251.1 LysR family transcriptional regulator [Methyloceanibacter methanicus]